MISICETVPSSQGPKKDRDIGCEIFRSFPAAERQTHPSGLGGGVNAMEYLVGGVSQAPE